MTKTEFYSYVAERCDITKKDAEEEVNDILTCIIDAMQVDGVLSLTGFGKFEIKNVEASERRNPSNGETVMVEAHKVPKFKFAQNIKKNIW